jgi:hypothetical protein
MRTAHKLKAEGAGDVAMAVELIDIHTPKQQELSLLARRSLLLMLEAAAGDAWKPQSHRIAKKDLRGRHASMVPVRDALGELMTVWFSHADLLDDRPATRMFHLIDEILDENDNPASAFIEFRFSKRACDLLERSDVYARLSREAIVKFRSAYSLRMYEIGSALYGRRDPVWRGDVSDLRKLLQVPAGVYTNFAQLRRRVLEPARDELAQLAEFDLTWHEAKKGRQVLRVELRFTPKAGRLAFAAAEENQRHSAGRLARRDGTADSIIEPSELVDASAVTALISRTAARLVSTLSWPADDIVSPYTGDGDLYRIGVEHGGGHAVDRIAAAYAKFMGAKRLELTGERLRSSWQGYCETKAKQWGRI